MAQNSRSWSCCADSVGYWKNPKPKDNSMYVPTRVEHLANIASHGLAIAPVSWILWYMVHEADIEGSAESQWVARVYAVCTVMLLTTSTTFHTYACFGKSSFLRDFLHRCDRAMIYIFIPGAYAPWLYLKHFHDGSYVHDLRWLIWVLACMGIMYQQLFHEQYKWLETTLYCFIALFPAVAVFEMNDSEGLFELQLGGAIYLIGVVFFKADGIIPLAHAIWHLHVVAGTVLHLYAVCTHLIPVFDERETTNAMLDSLQSRQEL